MLRKLLVSLCTWISWNFWVVPFLSFYINSQLTVARPLESATMDNLTTKIVATSSGQIRGLLIQTDTGKSIYRFLGVPYGMPPTGPMRFRLPRMVKRWSGVFDALTLAKACYQWRDTTFPGFAGTEIWNANTPMSEDCLNMNIWAPSNANNLATLAWIYGGGFIYGSPSLDLYDGQTLAAEGDVIVININYRIGPFGFLYFKDDIRGSSPGNMGLADQQLALTWIKENIKFFGGDPKRITIFGESAGAAGVSAHLFAKDSWNLFSYAILQSGFITAPWAYRTPDKAVQISSLLAEKCNCKKNVTRATVDCLRSVPAPVIQAVADSVNLTYMEFPFTAVSRENHFFRGDIFQLIKAGHVKNTSILIGSNADEGTFWLAYLNDYFNNASEGLIDRRQFDESVAEAFPNLNKLLRYAISYHYQSSLLASYNLHGHKTGHSRAETLYRDALKRMIADYYFNCDVLDAADYLSQRGSRVYAYYFSERSTTNPWPEWMGVMHAYEIEYIFGVPIRQPQGYTQKEVSFTQLTKFFPFEFGKSEL